MNNLNKYTTKHRNSKLVWLVLAVILAMIVGLVIYAVSGNAETELVKCWVLCQPGSQVNIRRVPGKHGMAVGFLEVGDYFMTDGTSKNGYIRTYGIGEYGEGWIYSGYVVTEEPVAVFDTYCCVAKNRVACRKWVDGPKTAYPWLKNGSDVSVFYIAGEWAVTSRGYIRTEWLEVDPV